MSRIEASYLSSSRQRKCLFHLSVSGYFDMASRYSFTSSGSRRNVSLSPSRIPVEPAFVSASTRERNSYRSSYKGDTVITAIWKKAIYVTFDANGGEFSSGKDTAIVASGKKPQTPTVKREGYTFTGWDKEVTNVIF